MFRLFTKVGLILFIAMLLSVGVDALYRQANNLKYQWPQNIWIKPQIPNKYQIVKLGNSHLEDGLTFEHFKMRSFSLATVAQSYEYDLARLKMYSNQIDKGAIVIINVSPLSFSQGKPDKTGSLAYKYYDGSLSPFVIPNLQVGNYLETRIVPFVRAVYLWRITYAKKVQEIAMNSYAANFPKPQEKKAEPIIFPTDSPNIQDTPNPPNTTNTPGAIKPKIYKTADEELASAPYQSDERLQDSVIFMVDKWRDPSQFGSKYIDTNSKDLEALIKYCLNHKWRPILISIPISQRLIDGLGPDYMQAYVYGPLKTTNIHNVEFIDFSGYKQFRENAY